MNKTKVSLLGFIFGTIVFLLVINPALYTLLMPVTFWQNFVMLLTVDLLAYLLTLGLFNVFLEAMLN